MNAAFPWPVPPGSVETPIWTGNGFRLGERHVPVLCYVGGTSNWTDDLTSFHEDLAGKHHAIDVASRSHAIGQIQRFVRQPEPTILEVGCSSGFLLEDLRRAYPSAFIIGSDYVRGPLQRLASTMPDLPLLSLDLVHCPLPDTCVDAVVLLNVLEHIEDHEAALRQVRRILKPGGVAVIEVPAGPHLYDVYDKLLMHWRRYSARELRELVKQAGFRIAYASHLGFLCYPGFAWVKRKNRRRYAGSDAAAAVVAQNIRDTGQSRLLPRLMRAELLVGQWVRYPVGIRCVITCIRD